MLYNNSVIQCYTITECYVIEIQYLDKKKIVLH